MKKWGIVLAVVAAVCAVVVGLALTAPGPPQGPQSPQTSATPEATETRDGGMAVRQGENVLYASRDGSPEVAIPGSALSGEGRLQLRPVALPEGQKGWNIDLSGAVLTGQATITFKNAVADGRPAPLIGFNENLGDPITYVQTARVSGNDLVVQTDHFSNWVTDSLEWLRGQMDRINASSGVGERPRCERESEARAHVQVESNDGGAVKWCLGQTSNGLDVLKVNNSRGYAVSMERTRGLSISKRSLDSFGDTIPNLLADSMTRPFGPATNEVDIIGPGETIEYRVHMAQTAKLRVDPAPAAYLATALWFAAQTTEMIYSRVYEDSVDIGAVGAAMDSADCVNGAQTVATADVSSPQKAGKFFDDALDFAMACSGRVLESMAKKQGADEIFLANVADVLAWAWTGAKTLGVGVNALIDTTWTGYVISLRRGAPGSVPSPEALPIGDTSSLTGRWTGPIAGDEEGYDVVLNLRDAGGKLSGTVSYPQLGCSGTWAETERTDTAVRFNENIDTDPNKACAKDPTARLTRTASGLHAYIKWIWIEATADLKRQ